MYTQKDIEEFAFFITLCVFNKAYKKYHRTCDIFDSLIKESFEDNPLLVALCESYGYNDEVELYYTRTRLIKDCILQDNKATFYKKVNAVYDINLLFKIGLTHQYIQRCIEDLPIPQEVLDDIFFYSAEVEAVITPQQLQYIESLEWDCDYWDSLPIEVIDSLDPEVRELCFEYYDSMLLEQALDPVEDTESMFEFGIDAVMSYEQLDMLGVETLTSHEVDEMLNTVESITVKVEPVRNDVKLLPPVIEPVEVVVPQEVLVQPQEDCLSTTTLNEDTMNNNTFVKFSEFYALCVYYHTMKHLHSIDIWGNGDAHKVYASQYSKALLSHYGYDDDEYLIDTSFQKDFSDVVGKLVHDPYDLWVIAHMTSKLVNDFRDELDEALWYSAYKAKINENYTKYVPIPTPNSQYIIACNVEVVEPVRDDVKLPEPVEVVVVPQEVVSEPQEGLSTTTQINGDDVMNNNTVWLDWSISTPCLKAWELDFGTYVPVVESEPVVEVVKPHYSDKWFGQCCDLNDNPEFTQWDIVRTGKPYFPEVVEFTPLPSKAPSIMNIGRGKVYFPIVLTPEQLDNAKAKIEATVIKAERKASLASPVKQRQVSPHATVPFGNAPEANRITNPKVTSAIGEAEAFKATLINPTQLNIFQAPDYTVHVTNCKTELLDCFSYDDLATVCRKYNAIDKQIVLDAKATMTKREIDYLTGLKKAYTMTKESVAVKSTPATPKATVAPKVSTATFASNFNSLVIAKYRELNNGIIKDSLVLNKLTSALRNNNLEAYNSLVTTFGNPTAVALHHQAYDAVISAS